MGDYLDALDDGIACHAAYLVPQGTVRMQVVGNDDRLATAAEHARMAEVVRQGLVDGAVGLSEVKEYGGLAVAQRPDEAEYAGMPGSAVATGLVDLVLSEQGPALA